MPAPDDESYCSSSDDDVGFESPDDNSDNEGRASVLDPFKFQAKSFTKVPSPTRNRKRIRNEGVSSELEMRLEQMERQKMARQQAVLRKQQQQQQQPQKKSSDNDSDDDDVDSVLEDLGVVRRQDSTTTIQLPPQLQPAKAAKPDQEVIELLDDSEDDDANKKPAATMGMGRATRSPRPLLQATPAGNTRRATAAAAAAAKPPAAKPVAADSALDLTFCSDDSDDEDGAVSRAHERRNNPLPDEVARSLRNAQLARSHLTQAQHYHAHDVYVPVAEPDPPHRFRSGASSTSNAQLSGIAKASLPLGKPFKVTCCTQLKIKGEEHPCNEESFTVRENESLQVLFDNYIRTLRLPKTAKVTMAYKNRTLTKHGTPKSFNLTNRARIQCTAEASYLVALNAASPSAPVFKSKKALGKILKIVCQLHIKFKDPKKKTKPLTSTLEIRELEKLSVLLEPMRRDHKIPANLKLTMSFDGEACENKTPQSFDMESEDIVEFMVKDVVQLWYKE